MSNVPRNNTHWNGFRALGRYVSTKGPGGINSRAKELYNASEMVLKTTEFKEYRCG